LVFRGFELVAASCTYCSGDAVYTREYEGVALCSRCFRESIEEKVRRTITRYQMLEFNDHIAVAVSGGKDSLTLLSILVKQEAQGVDLPQSVSTKESTDTGMRR
jgi:predicted PP-loop superfamily ATPase